MKTASAFMLCHADAVFEQLDQRYTPLKMQFDAIDAFRINPTFDDACDALRDMLTSLRSSESQQD